VLFKVLGLTVATMGLAVWQATWLQKRLEQPG
jgi:hypothetical protein